MSLSETEAEERLAILRRQRDAIDREIADLLLYLDLGRRLAPGRAPVAEKETHQVASSPRADHRPTPIPTPPPVPTATQLPADPAPAPIHPGFDTPRRDVPQPVSFNDDPTGAREYGRALIAAACEAIARAGRPLHAREILDMVAAQGFVVPGQDPVAALNTRLWKRAGDGGPLRRLGDAVYGLAEGGDDPQGSALHPQKDSPF